MTVFRRSWNCLIFFLFGSPCAPFWYWCNLTVFHLFINISLNWRIEKFDSIGKELDGLRMASCDPLNSYDLANIRSYMLCVKNNPTITFILLKYLFAWFLLDYFLFVHDVKESLFNFNGLCLLVTYNGHFTFNFETNKNRKHMGTEGGIIS